MTEASRARFAEAVRAGAPELGLACLLVGVEVEPHLDVDDSLRVLDDLAALARPLVPPGSPPALVAEGLRLVLGEKSGFAGSAEDYGDLRSSLLHQVLRRGRGLPLLLSVAWVEVAARIDAPVWPVALPGHVVVGIGDPYDEPVFADPFAGGRPLDRTAIDEMSRAAVGLPAIGLRPADTGELMLRLLTNIRVLTTRQPRSLGAARTRLWAVELSLLVPRHPLELRRERGELLARLGELAAGAAELEAYASIVEDADPELAETVRREARSAVARLN